MCIFNDGIISALTYREKVICRSAAWLNEVEARSVIPYCARLIDKEGLVRAARLLGSLSGVMDQNLSLKKAPRKFAWMGVIFAALGLLLFAFFIRNAGLAEIAANIRRLGASFLLILALSGVRQIVRALAWTRCFDAQHNLRFRDALRAYLGGDAVGNLVPLGIVVSEPAKVALVRDRVPAESGLLAIAIENSFYSLSVALFIFCGAAALLLSFPLPSGLRMASVAALVSIVFVLGTGFFLVRRQWKLLSGTVDYLLKRGIGRRWLETKREPVRALEQRIYSFYAGNRRRFLPILLLEACFHLAGVAEVYVTLLLISDQPTTLLVAFVLESVNRVINVVFKVVPLRVGVDEAGTGMLTQVLQLGIATGVTLAIIRKARILCWTGVGVALLLHRGLTVRAVWQEAAIASTKRAEMDARS